MVLNSDLAYRDVFIVFCHDSIAFSDRNLFPISLISFRRNTKGSTILIDHSNKDLEQSWLIYALYKKGCLGLKAEFLMF